MRQMIFDIPEDVADSFTRTVLPEYRSGVITQLLSRKYRSLTDAEWEASAKAANQDAALLNLERDWECTIADGLDEEPNEW